MLNSTISVVVLGVVLAVFVVVGLRAARSNRSDVSDYILAPGSQGAWSLGLSFLASGLGAWILFAPPELGVVLGVDAVVGYAVAAAGPFFVLAFVGPRLRRALPAGRGLTEFLRVRFGTAAGRVVALLSLLYMGVFVAAELVAVGGLAQLLGGIPPAATVLAVVAATLLYTTYGGLRASLQTDRWQSWLVVGLLAIAAAAALTTLSAPLEAVRQSELLGLDRAGVESAITLIIAVTAANLFHHGYWQRVWAAVDDHALRAGALLGAVTTIPVMLVAGGFGVLSAAEGLVDVPALALFAVVAELEPVVVAGVLALGIALVASSIDTLENGLAALLVAERPGLHLRSARLATIVIVAPAVLVALVANSVLRLFLIADLLCAALVAPALLGLWRRTTAPGVLSGALAGGAGAIAGGWVQTGSLSKAFTAVTFPDAVPTLAPFLGACAAGSVVTVAVSLASRQPADLAGLDTVARERSEG